MICWHTRLGSLGQMTSIKPSSLGQSLNMWSDFLSQIICINISTICICINDFGLHKNTIRTIFKSYGWTFPIILASWLLASGPKAFLMALALPLVQSALALAFEKLWGQTKGKPKRKYRMRRKSRSMNGNGVVEEPDENQNTRKGKTGYQSWVVENNGSVDQGSQEAPSFGGWDDLERPATRSSRVMNGLSQRMPTEGGRFSRRERKSDKPLLLRLLIAIFPFLGTWTKML
ncbi:hypothetical protein TanjilG_07712 [Lupinus angustifolius]|uniref:Uncharacterized protein n=1 Tax=Lupinus angustifolius TaxID=3871 RepID=A0A4P1RCA4_LUPAN|nr:hypothetical protein TanjilG_07712 [Lupinus angustifolius]